MKKNEFAARTARFLDALAEQGLGGAVIDNRDDYYYLTGYTGSDSVAVFAARARKGWIVTDSRYAEEAEKTAPGMETLLWRGNFGAFTGKLIKKLRIKKTGYTPHSLTAAFFQSMKAEAKTVSAWVDAGPCVAALRAVKSPAETRAVRAALACAEKAFLAARGRWRIGMTETDVKNDLEWEMRQNGADNASFETIVAIGANASLPHAHAGGGKIQAGKMLLIDFGAIRDRYCSDLTRTLWAGDVPAAWRKRYRAVLEAQEAGIAAIRAGAPGRDVHQKARDVFAAHGLADRFTHGLGHGVGLAVHESPALSPRYDKPLAAGNIVTVEPGVYFPGSGGIRVEDMALVTEKGVEILSSLPKNPDSVIL
ncbi:MAG: Xaa-Pro peptidase family protein [Planctomycetota bacterium]|jgi:Xaa-Pro aminopeptidase|nr:Xaa-Pro peptidase family protein [Planctomycetota bacterium]